MAAVAAVATFGFIELMLLSLLVRTKSKVPVDQSVMIVRWEERSMTPRWYFC